MGDWQQNIDRQLRETRQQMEQQQQADMWREGEQLHAENLRAQRENSFSSSSKKHSKNSLVSRVAGFVLVVSILLLVVVLMTETNLGLGGAILGVVIVVSFFAKFLA